MKKPYDRILNKLMLKAIKKYQANKAIIGTGHCRFQPTCSNFAMETYQKFSFSVATIHVAIRILRCNPFAKRRLYPVPLTKQERKRKREIDNIRIKLGPLFDIIVRYPNDIGRIIFDYSNHHYQDTTRLAKSEVIGNCVRIGLDLNGTIKPFYSSKTTNYSEYDFYRLFELGQIKEAPVILPHSEYPVVPIEHLHLEKLIELSIKSNSRYIFLVNRPPVHMNFTLPCTFVDHEKYSLSKTIKFINELSNDPHIYLLKVTKTSPLMLLSIDNDFAKAL